MGNSFRSSSDLSPVKQRPDERGNLLEYSVVYTDRAINLMSQPFQHVMRDISADLKQAYNAQHVAVIPGSGTFAMEAVARQFATNQKVLVIRNGYFSFRWSEIFEVGGVTQKEIVLKGDFDRDEINPQIEPHNIQKVVSVIITEKPAVVFAPQVETATGIMLTKDYIKAAADAVHSYGGIFVLDAIAAGTLWINMEECGVDVIISAPQKGWSGPACAGLVMLNQKAYDLVGTTKPTSFSCNLPKWLEVMKKYEGGAFMYHTTLPTDSLTVFRHAIKDTYALGLPFLEQKAIELGKKVREVCEAKGLKSVAKDPFQSPTVVVMYTEDAGIVGKFIKNGIQVAGGVPFKIDEPAGLICFRVGLFGLEKLSNVERTVKAFSDALDKVLGQK